MDTNVNTTSKDGSCARAVIVKLDDSRCIVVVDRRRYVAISRTTSVVGASPTYVVPCSSWTSLSTVDNDDSDDNNDTADDDNARCDEDRRLTGHVLDAEQVPRLRRRTNVRLSAPHCIVNHSIQRRNLNITKAVVPC